MVVSADTFEGIGSEPAPDEVEVTLIGPGYGECVVAHLGDGIWMVVDSCLNRSSRRAAALDYLHALNVAPETAVRLVVVTHWHDDHVRGLASLVSSCRAAEIAISTALQGDELLALAETYSWQAFTGLTSGVSEFRALLRLLKGEERSLILCLANRTIRRFPVSTPNGASCVVTALSPSDGQVLKTLRMAATFMPPASQPVRRIPRPERNDASVALWIDTGQASLLLGGDLEETGDSSEGWTAVLSSPERPPGTADLIKVPHHGSHTGHLDGVWEQMLVAKPLALVTPFRRGDQDLPTDTDRKRLATLTDRAYVTSVAPRRIDVPRRPPEVEKEVRQTTRMFKLGEPSLGWVQARKRGGTWGIRHSKNAVALVA